LCGKSPHIGVFYGSLLLLASKRRSYLPLVERRQFGYLRFFRSHVILSNTRRILLVSNNLR
jgi:hypothetical protein